MATRTRLGLLLLGIFACTRPVDAPTSGSSLITNVLVEPHFVRADTPLLISFQVVGSRPTSVVYDIGGKRFDCEAETGGDGRLMCQHAGLARADFEQGTVLVVVEGRDDDGKVSLSADQIVLDFECPRFVSLTLSAPIAAPGDMVTLNVEANEALRKAPRITRAGRDWDPVVGDARTWAVSRMISGEDPATGGPLLVRIEDMAGNSSADCGNDGMIDFKVDHSPPLANPDGIVLLRDAPGLSTMISASAGSFGDDVGLSHVRVLDETGDLTLATLSVEDDGSLKPVSLGLQTTTRVLLEAVDRFGRTSPRVAIPERWRLSIGAGSSPGSALRSAVRYTPAPPDTLSMRNRTVELAPDVFAQDARAAVIRARIGFEKVGELPTRAENVARINAGYEPVGRSIVTAGGYRGTDFSTYALWIADSQVLQWDEREGAYLTEQMQPLSYSDPTVPSARYGYGFAFDGQGCGVLFGGDALIDESDAVVVGDVWQLCYTPGGYAWTRIDIPDEVDGLSMRKVAPLIYDRHNARYVTVGGSESQGTRVVFLEPGADASSWRWSNLLPLPTNYGERFRHFLYYDPVFEGFIVGGGLAYSPGGGGQYDVWGYRQGQWVTGSIPFDFTFYQNFGWAYDEARHSLVVWGGSDDPTLEEADPRVWYFTGTATSGPEAWRAVEIDHPIVRYFPSLVYDSDREVVVAFGGLRALDTTPVPSEVHQIISQPSFPYLQATIDLGARRPKGIEALHLQVRASGIGDGDRLGPGNTRAGGYRVMLWDHQARSWDTVANSSGGAVAFEVLAIDVVSNPERYVSSSGTVPLTIVPSYPATEAVDGRLEIDLVDGRLDLRHGVALP